MDKLTAERVAALLDEVISTLEEEGAYEEWRCVPEYRLSKVEDKLARARELVATAARQSSGPTPNLRLQ
jgi:hypothetical protein